MPQPIPPGLRLGLVNPEDAAAVFARRNLLRPSFRWQDVFQEEHSRAFAVAGVMRMDILQVFRDEIERALTEGKGLEAFRKAIRPQLVSKGWWGDIEITDPSTGEQRIGRFNDRRLKLIYDVNLRQSHAAGRWARIERLKDRFPFVTYRTMGDERVRKSHAEWDGVTLPVDHEFWKTHYPPNGWSCRCTAFAVDDEGIAALRKAGVKVKTDAPPVQWMTWHNRSNDTFTPVPRGIDPGFAYNPGQSRDAAFFDVAMAKAERSFPREAAVVITQMQLDAAVVVARKTAEFSAWVDDVVSIEKARRAAIASNLNRVRDGVPALPVPRAAPNSMQFIGVIHPWAIRALAAADIEPLSAVIGVSRDDIIHALLDKSLKQVVPQALYGQLPTLLGRATALAIEPGAPDDLLYIIDVQTADGRLMKLVLQLDRRRRISINAERKRVVINVVRTTGLISQETLRAAGYQVLWGVL